MIMEIGIVAGDIWHHLDAKGKAKLSELVSALDKPQEMILMSLGWLAREGHVLLEGEGDYEITLRKESKAGKNK